MDLNSDQQVGRVLGVTREGIIIVQALLFGLSLVACAVHY